MSRQLAVALAVACAAVAWVVGGGAHGSTSRLLAVAGSGPVPSSRPGRQTGPRRLAAAGESDLALYVDLFAAGLAAGATVPDTVTAVSRALPGAVADRLQPVAAALSLGAPPEQAWAELRSDAALRPLSIALGRAAMSGAPPVDSLRGLAAELRVQRRLAATEAARTAGVRAVAPLGLCFLPAFVLLGVVPTVMGLAGAALTGG